MEKIKISYANRTAAAAYSEGWMHYQENMYMKGHTIQRMKVIWITCSEKWFSLVVKTLNKEAAGFYLLKVV